jgi:unsaturated chondroitin disaccharide hydrolase
LVYSGKALPEILQPKKFTACGQEFIEIRIGAMMNKESLNSKNFNTVDLLTNDELERMLSDAMKKIDKNLEPFRLLFPSHASQNNVYSAVENTQGWNTGFWTGILWLAYEATGDVKYKSVAGGHIPSFSKRIREKLGVNHHDMGFLYSLSCVAAYKLTGDKTAKEAAVMAADHLITRYHKTGKFIQAWGNMNDKASSRLIIDCLLNIPLLYWASGVTGDSKYEEIACNHFNTTIKSIIRSDASTYHTYFFSAETGKPERGATVQGARDDSCWARGQAWCIYGLMLTKKYKYSSDIMPVFESVTNYFLNRLPDDMVCAWDLIFTDNSVQRDSSAAAIAVCGILESLKYMRGEKAELYNKAAHQIMRSLYEDYSTRNTPGSNGLLLHGVYSLPENVGVDECNIWGDYFYMEAIVRMLGRTRLYW